MFLSQKQIVSHETKEKRWEICETVSDYEILYVASLVNEYIDPT